MTPVLIGLLLFPNPSPSEMEMEHARNHILTALVHDGFDAGGTKIRLPEPQLTDGMTAEAQTEAIRKLAGGETAARDLLRDSVTAPFVLKTRDQKVPGATIRVVELIFVVHADFQTLDPAEAARLSADRPTEAANMRFETKLLTGDELARRKIHPEPASNAFREWYSHLSASLLDRIAFETTDHVVATRSAESLVVASSADRSFDGDPTLPNRWQPLDRSTGKPRGESRPYPGGASFVKISRIKGDPNALFVEGHFAFVEPEAWFDGAPILRSKFGPIAQDAIRRLRRDAAKKSKP